MISAKRIYKLNRRPWQILAVLLVVKLLLIVRYFKIQKTEGNQNADDTTSGEKQVLSEKYPITKNLEMFDWHNYEFMKYESERTGNGEQGRGYMLTDPKEIEIDKRLELIEGINVFVSDKISVNRSVQDTRPKM